VLNFADMHIGIIYGSSVLHYFFFYWGRF